MRLSTWMSSVGACSEAMEWVGARTPRRAWAECKRGDWMLWALAKTALDRREVVRLCCDVALSVLPLTDDPRAAAAAIDAAEGWCAGEVSIDEVRKATNVAATNVAAVAATNVAAAAATNVAAAYAAAADAAAYAAAYAATNAAWREARADALAEIADLIRARVSAPWFAELVREAKP